MPGGGVANGDSGTPRSGHTVPVRGVRRSSGARRRHAATGYGSRMWPPRGWRCPTSCHKLVSQRRVGHGVGGFVEPAAPPTTGTYHACELKLPAWNCVS